ncbi:MAG: hypothetical protein ACJ77X_09440 [Chloroflexota bacterium]
MTGRGPHDAQPGAALPVFDRLAPPPPPALVSARIEADTGPGDVVADLFGRGGWVARTAIDRQRRAVSLEASPLNRMLAEVVLRPPDVRHLDAAFQGLAASPRRESSLKASIGEMFATRCATCERTLVIDEVLWAVDDEAGIAGRMRPVAKHYRCSVCRDQRGGGEARQAPLDADDLKRIRKDVGADAMRASLLARFPIAPGAEGLPAELLALHTGRQLVGLGGILERIESELRAAPVMAALRIALLGAILPASRLGTGPGRNAALRVSSGHVRPQSGTQLRERDPWLAFEEAFRSVRGFIQRLDAGPQGPVQGRLGEDLRSLGEGAATAFLGLSGPTGFAGLREDPNPYGRTVETPRIRLVLDQPPMRQSLERLAVAYHATAWVLGREAAGLLPIDGLAGASLRVPWDDHSATIETALRAVEPALARDGRVVQIVDGTPEAVVATVIAAAAAGYPLVAARLADPGHAIASVVESIPPGGRLPPGARTRANVGLDPLPGGAGDPDVVPSSRLFGPPERVEDRPFSPADATRVIVETAIETLRARGEPASTERLLGEVLVGLDRAGQLRRYVAAEHGDGLDRVEQFLGLVRDGLASATPRRLAEIEPGSWWLADPRDLAAAAAPLADRVEWAVYSLLSTAGPISETAFAERMATMFTGHDLADDALIDACLASYRSPSSSPDRVSTDDDLRSRSQEHTELLATIAAAGRRLGMKTWIGQREQSRRHDGGTLGDLLEPSERRLYLGGIGPSAEDLAEVDGIWYARGKAAFLFEVEWTAMLGETILRRHARIPPDDAIVRFLVIAPERAELVRFKLDRSPLLRAAMDAGNWHVIKSDQLRTFLGADSLDLADLEPYLGLDTGAQRGDEQMPLFES